MASWRFFFLLQTRMPRRYEADGSVLTRWTYFLLAAVAAVFAILSIFQLVIAFQDYRMVDFEAATANTDMKNLKDATLPTCIEGITKKTVEANKDAWNKTGVDDCIDNGDTWNKGLELAIQNTAHLFFYALNADTPLFEASNVFEWERDAFYNAAQAAVGSILAAGVATAKAGCTGARYNCRAETFKRTDSMVRPLHHRDAYTALVELADLTTGGTAFPVSTCTAIYAARHTGGAAALTFDTDYERRVARAAQDIDGFTLPVDAVSSKCDTKTIVKSPYATQDGWWDAGSNKFVTNTAQSDANINLLYTHCVIQHSYKSSGQGVLQQPQVGLFVGNMIPDEIKAYQFYQDVKNKKPSVDDYKEPISHTANARLYLGRRYGDTVLVYTVLILSGAFLCGVALMVVLVEATRRERYEEAMNLKAEETLFDWKWFKVISDRYFYFAWSLAAVGLVVGFVLWIIKIVAFYGGSQGYTRPVCHSEVDESGDPYKDIALRGLVDDTNRGGWLNDVDAHQYEILCLILQASALAALMLGRRAHHANGIVARILRCFTCNQAEEPGSCAAKLLVQLGEAPLAIGGIKNAAGDSGGDSSDLGTDQLTNEEAVSPLVVNTAVKVDNTKIVEKEWIWGRCCCDSQLTFAAFLVLGAAFIFGGQAFASYWFGVTWARAVLDVEYAASEHVVYTHLVSQTVVLFGTTGAVGAIVATTICAFMIRGTGGWAPIVNGVRTVWLLYIALFFVVMLQYWNQQYDSMDIEKSRADCTAVYGTSEDTKNNADVLIDDVDVCEVRWVTYVIGIVLLVMALLLPIFWKCVRCCQKRSPGKQQTRSDIVRSDMRAVGNTNTRTLTGERNKVPGANVADGETSVPESTLNSAGTSQARPFRFPVNGLRPNMRVSGYAQHVNGLDNFLRSPQGQAAKPIDIRHVSRR